MMEEGSTSGQDPLAALTNVFTERMDANEDGDPVVPYSQLEQLLAELGLPQTAIPALDENGFIHFEPFINNVFPLLELQSAPADSEQQVQAQRNAFYMLSNGASTITQESLMASIKPLGLKLSEQDVRDICPSEITKVEFIQLWKRLVLDR